jgi:hypothetical protein
MLGKIRQQTIKAIDFNFSMLIVIEAICLFSGRSLGAVGCLWKNVGWVKTFSGQKQTQKT